MKKILFGILLSMSIVSIPYQTFTSQPKQWSDDYLVILRNDGVMHRIVM